MSTSDPNEQQQQQQRSSSCNSLSNNSTKKKKSSKRKSTKKKNNEITDEDYRAQLINSHDATTKVTGVWWFISPSFYSQYIHGIFFKLHYGEQLTDDLLNSFCDKVQATADEELEGFMAIQTVHLMPEIIPTIITGKKRVLQIILDSHRKHYILLEWNPKFKDRGVIIYDSFIENSNDMEHVFNNSFKFQFLRLFDHIYPSTTTTKNAATTNDDDGDNILNGMIPCKLETFVYAQNDNWSCGLRAAALLVLRAFNGSEELHGGEIYISVRRFHHVLKSIMIQKVQTITKEDFRIDSWFKKVSYSYHFGFFAIRKHDSKVLMRYQNYNRYSRQTYVTCDENDNISRIEKSMKKLNLSSSSIDDDDDGNGSSSSCYSRAYPSATSAYNESDGEKKKMKSKKKTKKSKKMSKKKDKVYGNQSKRRRSKNSSSSQSNNSSTDNGNYVD